MRSRKPYFNRKLLIAGAILLLILVVAILELTNTTHLFHKEKVPPVIPARTNTGAQITSPNNTDASNSSGSDANNVPVSTPDTTDHTLITPTGNFVSNHFPGQNGSPTTESSTCNTTPGATCYIKFTDVDSGATTQLPAQTADARGSTSWYWDINKDAHLTSGRWNVTAIASLGGQSKSADDSLKLTIQ